MTSFVGLIQWSHDGRELLFDSLNSIYKVNADGTGLAGLATGSSPIWSPDGRKIAYEGPIPDGIWVMNSDGSNQVRLTDPANHDTLTDWQALPGPRPSDYKDAAQFCKAERAFLGEDQFRRQYGAGPKHNGANAFGKCVSRNTFRTGRYR
jgi:Tol biopolymer transport system component